MHVEKTFCRICEALCGLEIEVEDKTENIIKVRPDKTHPVSQGYVCIKGMGLGALHQDPARLNHPLKKKGETWEKISWAQAISEIGEKIRAIKKQHSPRAIGMYAGNPTFFNFKNVLYVHDFLTALGSPNLFASHSIDVNNKLYTAMKVYGRSMVHPLPDFETTDFLMCFGTNPVVSQMSVLSIPNALGQLQAIEARGGTVIMVDPRRTETAEKVGDHLFIRPGTDIYLLLGMLHILAEDYRPKLSQFEAVAEGVETFLDIGAKWTPARCAKITGIAEDKIRAITKQYFEAKGASLYMSTGVNMGPFGSLAYWLIQGLSLLSGNLDKPGGQVFYQGAFDAIALAEKLHLGGEEPDRTLQGNWPKVAGAFPSNALIDEILIDHPDKVRALFIHAGNPAHSIPGHRLGKALEQLDLIVSIDIYHNETAQYADYILPATDMLERSDYPISWTDLRSKPWAQYTDRVVAPKFERREEWEILSDLAIACGTSPLKLNSCGTLAYINHYLGKVSDNLKITPETILSQILRQGKQVTLKKLKDSPQGLPLAGPQPGEFLGKRVPTPNKKMQLSPEALMTDLPRLETVETQLLKQEGLVLIGRRERKTHNGWMHNSPHIKHMKSNLVTLNPIDSSARNIIDGDRVTIVGNGNEITLPVRVSDEIMPGVIAIPHGWGHGQSGVQHARVTEGENVNQIIPGGTEHMEPTSGQAIMLGHRVEVRKTNG